MPVTLSWAPVGGATRYTLVISTSPTFSNTLKSVSQAGTSYAFTGLTNGATYYWRVKVAAPSARGLVGGLEIHRPHTSGGAGVVNAQKRGGDFYDPFY